MPELNQTGSTDVESGFGPEPEQKDEFAEIGQYTSFDWVPEPHYFNATIVPTNPVMIPDEFDDSGDRDLSPLSEDAMKALMELDRVTDSADIAPRRIEIEQAWRANHYERGYQFLVRNPRGGWSLPGQTSSLNAKTQSTLSTLYHTNVYAEKGEVIVAALAREVPRVEFFPVNPDHAPDQDMADVADDLKDIWAKNNNLMALLQDAGKLFWTDDRVLFWTRYELNGDLYGYEEPDQPVVPENELTPPTEPTDDTGSEEYQVANSSPVGGRKPRGRVITTASGKLSHRLPINSQSLSEANYLELFADLDQAVAKAQFPWMRAKIKGGGDGTGETELDRIARENVNQAVPGQYVTGDSLNRHTVRKHKWFRKAMFFDEMVGDAAREELLAKFPDGVLMVKAGSEFAFARNECMDDVLAIAHPFPGKGQNRRALGESLLPIQDYINELVMLALDFAKRTIAKKWMDADAFNIEAVRSQKNVPGDIGPFTSQPGKSVDQLIFIEPTPSPQPWLITFVQWAIGQLSEQISGALPSLFGAQITGQVGSEGVAIQRDAALQRVGCPWNSLQFMFAEAARQAVTLTARCTNHDINDVIPGRGAVSIKVNNLKGAVMCYPEANPEFPESWAQKEARVMSVVDKAMATPGSEFSNLVMDPKNLKAIKSAIRLPGFNIKGESSVEKQEAEFELLLRAGPNPNPEKMKLGQQIAQAGAMGQIDPQVLQQAQQQLAGMPDAVSSVAVRQDDSENHDIEASVCFDWLNSPDGRKFEYGNPAQKLAFQNVLLHRADHMQVAAKLKAANAPPPPPPKVSFSVSADKMPPTEQAAIMSAGGIPANPADFALQQTQNLNAEVAKRVIPDVIYANSIKKDQPEPAAPPTTPGKPTVQ